MANWTRFNRRHRGDFTLQCRRPYAPYRLRRQLLRTHKLKRMLIKEPVPTVNDCSTLFSADMSQAKNAELLIVVCFTRLRCTVTPCPST